MNRFSKGACLGLVLILSTAVLSGCKSEKDITDKLTIVTEVSDKMMSVTEGEILVNETLTLENDIEGVIQGKNTETYVRFSNGPESPDFELERTEYINGSGASPVYTFVKSGETMLELFDGVGDYAKEAPDIYEELRIDFDAEDIVDVEITDAEKLNKCYAFTMTEEYANKYDAEDGDISFDCTGVVISFYIDSVDRLTKRTCDITYTLTVNGEAQTATEFIEAKIH